MLENIRASYIAMYVATKFTIKCICHALNPVHFIRFSDIYTPYIVIYVHYLIYEIAICHIHCSCNLICKDSLLGDTVKLDFKYLTLYKEILAE